MSIERNILVTGGRAPATLYLIRRLAEEGLRVFCAESQACHLSARSRYLAGNYRVRPPRFDGPGFTADVLDIIRRERIDLVIPTCEEVFALARAKPLLSDFCRVFCEDLDTLAPLHDKWQFSSACREAPARPVRTWLIRSRDDLAAAVAESSAAKWVLKPVYSRFATRVRILRRDSRIQFDSAYGDAVLQEFIEGVPLCSYSIADRGRLTLHADYQPVFSAGPNGAAAAFRYVADDGIRMFVENFFSRAGLTGQFAFDFIRNADGLHVLECNPRLTSGIQLFGVRSDVGRAFTGTAEQVLRPCPGSASALKAVFGYWRRVPGVGRVSRLDALLRWPDPVWDRNDRGPFWRQLRVIASLLRLARAEKISMTEATTHDIEWNGE